MKLATVVDRFDRRLDIASYADVDGSPNGLQVGQRTGTIARAGVAVDAAQVTIAEAIERDVGLLITHHGLWWEGTDRVTGPTYDRLANLIEHDIALYVAHLPLDGHQELGNAAGVARALNLETAEPFGMMGELPLGQRGRLPTPVDIMAFEAMVQDRVVNTDRSVRTLPFGPTDVEDIAIVTGAGGDFLDDAVGAGADVLLTGEGKQSLYHECKEAGINLVLAGHYQTETFGVRALGNLAEGWGIDVTFIDHPTGF